MMATAKKKAPKPAKPVGGAPSLTTRAQQEAHIRSLGMRCRGLIIPERLAQWQKLMDAGKVEDARRIDTRLGCGADFSETVLSEPFDGKDHETTCKQCGTMTRWKSPVFGT